MKNSLSWYLKKHVKEIVSNMTERKTKKPKTHKIQLKAMV